MFGIPPQLERPVHDFTGSTFTKREFRKLGELIHQIERRFPQVQIAIVAAPSCDPSPLAAQAFWLFNRGALFSASDSGGDNFGILLLIDTDQSQATAIIGYGLEVLMPDEILAGCLEATRATLEKNALFHACTAFLGAVDRQLDSVYERSYRAFGLTEDDNWIPQLQELTSLPSDSDY